MARWMLIGLVLVLLRPAPTTHAQDDGIRYRLYEFNTQQGLITVEFPAMWYVNDLTFGLDFVDFRNRPLPPDLPTNLVEMVVLAPADVNFAPTIENSAFEYFDQYRVRQLNEAVGVYGDPVAVDFGIEGQFKGVLMAFNERLNVRLRMDADSIMSLGMAVTLSNDALLIINFQVERSVVDEFAPIREHMLASLTFEGKSLWNADAAAALTTLESAHMLDAQYVATYDRLTPTIDEEREYTLSTEANIVTVAAPSGWMRANFILSNTLQFISPVYLDSMISAAIVVDKPQPVTAEVMATTAFQWDSYPAEATLYQDDVAFLMTISVDLGDGFWVVTARGLIEHASAMQHIVTALGSGVQINGEALADDNFSAAMIQMQIPPQ